MGIKEYGSNSAKKKKKKQYLDFWNWIIVLLLLFWIVSISILTYHWWTKRQELERLQEKAWELREQNQQEYYLQQKHLISLNSLVDSPAIHSFFSDLLKTYSEKFAKSKEIDISHLPLKFESLYLDENIGKGYGEMGRCFTEIVIYPYQQKIANISLNHLYLLNKFGCDKYFTNNPAQSGDYTYIDISFKKMIDTCSHEIAHYIQLVKYGKSSCESDLILGNGKYDGELAREHEEWTEEICGIVKLEISEWEKKWKEI